MSNSPTGARPRALSSEDVNREVELAYTIAQQNTVIFIRSLVTGGLNWAEVTLLLTKTLKALKPKETGAETRAAVAECLDPPGTIQERFDGWELRMLQMLQGLLEAYEREIPAMVAHVKAEVGKRGIADADTVRRDIEFMNEWTRHVDSHLKVINPGMESMLLTVREAATHEASLPPGGSPSSSDMGPVGRRMSGQQ